MKIYIMYVGFDYEGKSEPSITANKQEALDFLNNNSGDDMNVDLYHFDQDNAKSFIKSYVRYNGKKRIEDIE